MLSDELFGNRKGSLTDQLQLIEPVDVTAPLTDEEELELDAIKKGLVQEHFRDIDLGKGTLIGEAVKNVLAPSVEEFDKIKSDPILSEEFKQGFMETLRGYKTLATQPMEAVKGGAEFVLSIPGFALGILAATQRMLERMGGSFTLNDLYEAASEGMADMQKYWGEKMVEPLLGPPTEASHLVGQTAMAPAIGVSILAHHLANFFEKGPYDIGEHVKGLLKFAGDIVGLAALGRIYRGPKSELTAKVEDIVKKTEEIVKAEEANRKIPDESIRAAQQEIINLRKKQLELSAKELMENLDYDKMIKEDLSSKTRRIKKIKQPKKYILDEAINRAMEKLPEATKEPIKEQLETTTKKRLETPTKERAKRTEVEDLELIKSIEKEYGKKIEEISDKEIEDFFVRKYSDEHVTEVDLHTGAREPVELSPERSPFRERNPEVTANQRRMFEERKVSDSPETLVAKLLNDVNSWLDGNDKVNISKVRDALSDLATAVNDPANKTALLDYFDGDLTELRNFSEMVSEAAKWARRAERPKAGEVTLNMMIPLDKVPEAVKEFLLRSKKFAGKVREGFLSEEIYRNVDLWKKTGYWLGKDWKWRREIREGEAKLYKDKIKLDKEGKWKGKVGDVLDYPELYKSLPKAKDIKLVVDVTLTKPGWYNPYTKTIFLKSPGKRTLFHELQHAINDLTSSIFRGAELSKLRKKAEAKMAIHTLNVMRPLARNSKVIELIDQGIKRARAEIIENQFTTKWPKWISDVVAREAKKHGDKEAAKIADEYKIMAKYGVFKEYLRDPGEMEARLAARRMQMTKEQRERIPPWETLDKMIEAERLIEPGETAADVGVNLYMMIPLDKAPELVREFLLKTKKFAEKLRKGEIKVEDVYRDKELWKKTGFWFGRDGKWRYELKKGKAEFRKDKIKLDERGKWKGMLVDVLDYPELYKAVPGARDLKLVVDKKYSMLGGYNPRTKTIYIKHPSKTSLIHELQHAINDLVGSSFRGANLIDTRKKAEVRRALYALGNMKPLAKSRVVKDLINEAIENVWHEIVGDVFINDWPSWIVDVLARTAERYKDKEVAERASRYKEMTEYGVYREYLKDPGEMEARLAEIRMRMSEKQRKEIPPWETLDEMVRMEKLAKPWKPASSVGKKLYSGIPIDPELLKLGAKDIVKGAKAVAEYTRKAREIKSFKPKEAYRLVKEEFIRKFVDRSGNIRNKLLEELGEGGYEVIQKMYLSKGANALAANMLKQMRNEVYGGLSRNEKRILDNLILADRMIDISKYKTSKRFKFPKGISPRNSIAYKELFEHIEGISPDRAKLLRRRAEAYFEWMKKPLRDMLESGLITKQEYNDLVSHKYRRVKLVDIYDKRYQVKVGKKKRTVYDSGVEALARGRSTDIFEPSSEVMALEVFNRAYGRILNNEANKALLEIAREHPDNPFARVRSKESKIPSGWNRVFLYEGGERKAIYLSPEMSKEWIINSPEISYSLGQLLRYASLSPVLRIFATGINWGFALANIPIDVMHALFTARIYKDGKWRSIYSPHLPVFPIQLGRDLATVFVDAALKRGRYEKYIKEGGGMEFLVHQGRIMQRGRHVEGTLDKVLDFFGYLGEVSEIMVRLAIRERVIRRKAKELGISVEEARKNKDITREATFAARDYMDFGQGGGFAKAADNALPYLNAAIQGTRGLLRAFKPGSGTALSSTYKLAQLASVVVGLRIAMRKMHPESTAALQGNIDMQNNLCIPLGDDFGFMDEKGNMRYPYIKIPLDPGQKFFKTFFEAAVDKRLGYDVDVDTVVDSLKEFSPVGVTELPPSVSGVLGYVTNKDFWLNEDIWKKTEPFSYPKSRVEFTSQTPQFYIDVGEATGLSPERLRYVVEELTTNGTVWSYLLGQAYEAVFGDLPAEKKRQHLALTLARMPVVKRFFGVTNPYSKYASMVDKAQEEAVFERFVQNSSFDILVEGYLYGEGVSREDVIKEANKYKDVEVRDRLLKRLRFEEAIKDLPNKSFWRRMKGLMTEAKARVFVERLKKASPEERDQLWEEYGIISKAKGVISPDFRREVMRLMSEER